tara:strand:- start:1912 stop:2088 length:177 start_codon:yes stop_codon:yes gene_type:complete
MEEKFNINEILDAVQELNTTRKNRSVKNFKLTKNNQNDNSEIPKDTLRLIEEAEKKLN